MLLRLIHVSQGLIPLFCLRIAYSKSSKMLRDTIFFTVNDTQNITIAIILHIPVQVIASCYPADPQLAPPARSHHQAQWTEAQPCCLFSKPHVPHPTLSRTPPMDASERQLNERAPVPGVEVSGGKRKSRREGWQNPDPPEYEVSQPSTDQAPQGGVATDAPRLGTLPASPKQCGVTAGPAGRGHRPLPSVLVPS